MELKGRDALAALVARPSNSTYLDVERWLRGAARAIPSGKDFLLLFWSSEKDGG